MTFNHAVEIIIRHEGSEYHTSNLGYYKTKYGISDRTHGHINIKDLSKDQAKAIHHEIWIEYKMSELPSDLRLAVFSIGTLLGFNHAFRILSSAVNLPFQVEALTPDLKAKLIALEPKEVKSVFIILVLFRLLDAYDFQKIGRSILPRLIESACL